MGKSRHIKIQRQKKVVCGVNDAELEGKFYNREVLVENLDEIKKDMHKVDMSIVMMKLSAVGKRMEKSQNLLRIISSIPLRKLIELF